MALLPCLIPSSEQYQHSKFASIVVFARQCVFPKQYFAFQNKVIERILNKRDFTSSDTLFVLRIIWGKGLILYSHPVLAGHRANFVQSKTTLFYRLPFRTSVTPSTNRNLLKSLTQNTGFALPLESLYVFYSFGGELSPVFFFCVQLSVMTFVSTTFFLYLCVSTLTCQWCVAGDYICVFGTCFIIIF